MKKYKYSVLTIINDFDKPKLISFLNNKGSKGWILSCVDANKHNITFFFYKEVK